MGNSGFPLQGGDEVHFKAVESETKDYSDLVLSTAEATSCSSNHIPKHLKASFNTIILSLRDVFRFKLGLYPPLDFPPINIEFYNE